MKLRALLVAASLATLGGCVGGPPPQVPTAQPELPARFHLVPPDASGSMAELLPAADPAFAALVQRALTNSPTLGEALARIDEARARAARARAERLPEFAAEGSVAAARSNPAQFGANLPQGVAVDSERISYAANLTARWDADLFGRLRAQRQAAQARTDAATASAHAVRIALIADIATAVIDWRSLDAREAALNADLTEARRIVSLADSRARGGLAPALDRVQAQSAVDAVLTRLAALDSERSRLLGRLTILTAQGAGDVRTTLMQASPTGVRAAPVPAMPATLLQNRPDILAAAALLEAQDAELAATARQRFPALRLDVAIGLLAFGIGNLFDTESVVGSLAGAIAAPLLDFGRIAADIEGAAAAKKAAFERYRGAVYTALGEAEAAYGLLAASDQEAAAAQDEMRSLERAATLAETRQSAGLADFTLVSQARRSLMASRERSITAHGRALRARIVLWQALGGSSAAIPAQN